MNSENKNKILIIDDDPHLGKLLQLLLSPKGYGVDTEGNGKSGLARVKKEPYDVIITDINMPEMDGISLYTKIREEIPGLEKKVLFITSDTSERILSFFSENNCNYLYKPFRNMDLIGQIGALLNNGGKDNAGKTHMPQLQ